MSEDHQEPTSFVAPPLEELNNLLDGYQFESFIAQGGMGAVYLARQTSLDRQVAVKVLPREFGEDESFRESFQTEAKLMAKLNSPNLIGIYDFGDIDGMLYIIMEYVKGKSLHEAAHGKAIKQETAVEIIRGICSGLKDAHNAGILHRDIKPANILLGSKAIPKVGDFGLARPSGNTETGVIYGTPGYSAPEVLDAPEMVDNRTDIFAVGVMLYELLTGQMPSENYVSVSKYTDTDPRFDTIIQKAINPDINQRHRSVEDLRKELTDVIKNPVAANKLLVAGSGNTRPSRAGLATGNAGANSKVASSSRHSAVKTAPGNGKIIRNIVIIFLLLGAIYTALKMKDRKAADVAAEQKKIDAIQDGINYKNRPFSELKPLEKLEVLKDQLVNGEIPMEKMPETIFSLDRESRLLMYVDKKMTWDEADTWTREHGGYIAVYKSKSDLTLLLENIPADIEDTWLGGGCSGNTGWSWVDGTPWTDTRTIKPADNRSFVKLSKDGSVGNTDADKKLNFFIEWRADGTNPAKLEYRLLRAADTLADDNPEYPPGTVTYGANSYCIIKSPVTFRQANELANISGGHLIAISGDDEKVVVEDLISKYCTADETLWTAAVKENTIWGWQTKEKWFNLEWLPSHPKNGTHAVISVNDKLLMKDVMTNNLASGFILEWSITKSGKIAKSRKVSKSRAAADRKDNNNKGPSAGHIALRNKGKTIVREQLASTAKSLDANVKQLAKNLENYKRRLFAISSKEESANLDNILDIVQVEPRIPVQLAGQGSSQIVKDYINDAVKKQTKIDSQHASRMEVLRTSYMKQLRKIKQNLETKGQTNAVNAINKEAKRMGVSIAEFENFFR